MTAIHQFVASFTRADAISNEADVLRGIFRVWGHASEIFTDPKHVQRERRHEVRAYTDGPASCGPDDVALLHLSTGSPVNRAFADLPCRKAILYHNITPPEFFEGLQERVYRTQGAGRDEARALAGVADVNMAVSAYNAKELTEMGYRDVRVVPLLLDFSMLRGPANRSVLKEYRDGLVNILFVGRCAQNKKVEDCLGAFHYFQKYVQPASRFIYVGAFGRADPYFSLLHILVKDLRLQNVVFAGRTPQDELNAYYKAADLFLCMSEHEGFCIPVLESMVHGVPVLAYRAAAVPDTMDGAGVLFDDKRFDQVAEMMGRLTGDEDLRASVLEGQRQRLQRYEAQDLEAELRNCLAPLL
jgi:glycosyltransferase involved in cell wall biosynthesis